MALRSEFLVDRGKEPQCVLIAVLVLSDIGRNYVLIGVYYSGYLVRHVFLLESKWMYKINLFLSYF